MPTQIDPRGAVSGVFHYLDSTLPESETRILETNDIGVGAETREHNKTRLQVATLIGDTFRLMHYASPVRKELDAFRLFHDRDMADAIAAAYGLHRRGLNPVDALAADYALNWSALMSWEDEREMAREENSLSRSAYLELHQFKKEGDRFVGYHTPPFSGYILVRGDRLVWQVVATHALVSYVDPAWDAAIEHYQSLGGTRGFLAGKFDWPPVGWVNPMVGERGDAERARRANEAELETLPNT